MARKPNFDFEKRQREKAKAEKAKDRAEAKAARKATPLPDEGGKAPDATGGDTNGT